MVETLLGYGADVHIRGGKQRETPLHIAARIPDGKIISQAYMYFAHNPAYFPHKSILFTRVGPSLY